MVLKLDTNILYSHMVSNSQPVTNGRLQDQQMELCSLCNDTVEIRNHLFFQCTFSKEVWRGLTQKLLGSAYTIAWDQLLTFLVHPKWDKMTRVMLCYVFQAFQSGPKETKGISGNNSERSQPHQSH